MLWWLWEGADANNFSQRFSGRWTCRGLMLGRHGGYGRRGDVLSRARPGGGRVRVGATRGTGKAAGAARGRP